MPSSQKKTTVSKQKQTYKQHVIALRRRVEKENVAFKTIMNNLMILFHQCEQQKGVENKAKIFKQIVLMLKKHKSFVHAHPRFALTVSNKLIEFHNIAPNHFVNNADAEAFQMYCHSAYKNIFGCEFPIDKVQSTANAVPQPDESNILVELFHKMYQSNKADVIGPIQTQCESSLVCKYTMKDRLTKFPLFDATVELTNMHDASKNKNVLTAYISYFTIRKESRGQRKCTEAFTSLLNHLKSLHVDVITLYIGSNTPKKACACYIHGAKKSGYFIVNSDAEQKCADGYRLVFTKENIQKKYTDIWSKLEELKKDHASYLLQNYTQRQIFSSNPIV